VTTTDPAPDGGNFRPVFVRAGRGGWGRGLELTPTPDKYKVISVTGGGIHPVAQRIAELSGGEAVDGFRTKVEDAEVLAAVINCGGTARIGVYPRKRIPTVDAPAGHRDDLVLVRCGGQLQPASPAAAAGPDEHRPEVALVRDGIGRGHLAPPAASAYSASNLSNRSVLFSRRMR